MATLPLPAATVQATEAALVELYRQRLEGLAQLAPPGSGALDRIERLDRRLLDVGFSDDVADEVERLAAELDAQHRRFAHLLATDEGRALQRRAVVRLERAEQDVRALAAQLSLTQAPATRLTLGQTLRGRLAEHREAFRAALQLSAEQSAALTGTGLLTAQVLDLNLSALEAEAREGGAEAPAPSDAPEPSGLRSIDLARLVARGVQGERQAEEGAARHLAAEAPAAEAASIDPALTELLRARVEPQRQAPAATNARLQALDAELATAARTYGQSYTLGQALQRLIATPADDTRDREIAELAALRANLHAQRMSATSPDRTTAAALQQEHTLLLRQAATLRATVDAGRAIAPTEALAVAQGFAQDASRLSHDPRLPRTLVSDFSRVAGEAIARLRAQAAPAPGDDDARTAAQSAAARSDEARAAMRALTDERAELASGPMDAAALHAAVDQGAREDAPRSFAPIATDRIVARSHTSPWLSILPDFSAGRVLVHEDDANADAAPLARDRDRDRLAYAPGAGLTVARAAQRAARGIDVSNSVATEVQSRRHTHPDDANAPLAHLGEQVSRSLASLSGLFEAGLRSTRPLAGSTPLPDVDAAFAPRMAASMPGNIYADTSSARMQQVYMPALARVAGIGSARAAMPRANRSGDSGGPAQELATPEALFFGLLGPLGVRLQQDQPEVAKRLQGQLKPVAELIPGSGDQALQILSKYTQDMRTRVEGWLGLGATGGISKGGDTPHISRLGGSLREIGQRIGGILSKDGRHEDGEAPTVADHNVTQTEEALRRERFSIEPALVNRLSTMFNRALDLQAFRGPTSGNIAKEMGANGFNVKSSMFFGTNTPSTDTAEGRGLFAHELTHAILGNTSSDKGSIAEEERLAYGVQDLVQNATAGRLEDQIARAFSKMELAKELHIPPAKLPTEPGGSIAETTGEPAPQKKLGDAGKEADREEHIFETLCEAVLVQMREEIERNRERRGLD